jgi:MFS family permease
MIISGWIVYALVYLGFGFLRDGYTFWGLFACYGLFFGLTEAAERALISDLAPEDLRGTAYGLYHLAIGVSILPASLIMGALWQAFGIEVAFTTGAGLALIAMILFTLLIRSDL